MKVLVEENKKEDLVALMGKNVTLFGMNYIYHGKLVGVGEFSVKLHNASIVYETGKFSDKNFKDIQSLETEYWYVGIGCIESFGVLDAKE